MRFIHDRKAKQSLLTEGVQALQKLKKKGKGVNKAVIEEREQKVSGRSISYIAILNIITIIM